jgi:hypothetical protein
LEEQIVAVNSTRHEEVTSISAALAQAQTKAAALE